MSRGPKTTRPTPGARPSAPPPPGARRAGSDGFSLVELTVALAISLGLILIAATATTQSNRRLAQTRELAALDDTKEHVTRRIGSSFLNAGRHLVRVSPAASTSTTYTDEVLADQPSLWWRLDDRAGSATVADSSQAGTDTGTVNGTVSFGSPGALNSDTDSAVTVQQPQTTATNLAQGKQTFQSSTLALTPAPTSNKAVDGNADGNYWDGSVTHTNYETNPWWYVDLGGVYQLTTVKIWNRTDCCSNRLANFYVFVSDTAFTSASMSVVLNQSWVSHYYVQGPVAAGTSVDIGRTGRYVGIALAGTDYLSLAEVQVLGYPTQQQSQLNSLTSPALQTPPGDFSVEWWLNPSAFWNYNQVMAAGNWGSWVFHTTSDGAVYCGTDLATRFTPSDIPPGTLTTGVWHHFVYTYSGGTGSLYLNGRLLASRAQTRPSAWTNLSASAVSGVLDEVALYPKALTSDRVKAHYIAGVAPPVPQNSTGVRIPRLPLAAWRTSAPEQPAGPVTVSSDGSRALLISADDDFSPTQTEDAFTPSADAASRPLRVRAGVRALPAAGDYLMLIDYEQDQTALVRVTAAPTVSPSIIDPNVNMWEIPVAVVGTSSPAWGMMASPDSDLSHTFSEGSTVVRLSPPVVYYLSGTHLVQTSGGNNQTLALGATGFSVTPDTSGTKTAWVVNFEISGEGVEASSDSRWNQRASASLSLAPFALNPGL